MPGDSKRRRPRFRLLRAFAACGALSFAALGAWRGADLSVDDSSAASSAAAAASPSVLLLPPPLPRFVDVFRYMCDRRVPRDCCRNYHRLDVLDGISLRLSAVVPRREPRTPGRRVAVVVGADDVVGAESGATDNATRKIAPPPPPPYRDPDVRCDDVRRWHRGPLYGRRSSRPPRPLRYPGRNRTVRPAEAEVGAGTAANRTAPAGADAPHFPGADVFTGRKLGRPRYIVDTVLMNNELDALEARLYELNHVVDLFVVAESGYNHRGLRKLKFLNLTYQSRFAPFRDKLVALDVDLCPEYMREVTRHRRSFGGFRSKSNDGDNWAIQAAMRACVWTMMKEIVDTPGRPLPDDALVIFSDLDELPSASILKHVKHCEPTEGLDHPFCVTISHDNVHAPRLGIKRSMRVYAGLIVWVQSIRYVRRHDKLAFRADAEGHSAKTTPALHGGFHMQGYGSLADYVYREFSHAEGGVFQLVDRFGIDGWCDVTEGGLVELQRRYSRDPLHFFWKLARDHPVYNDAEAREPTEEELNGLRESYVPWAFIEDRARYPFQWGNGTYYMYSY